MAPRTSDPLPKEIPDGCSTFEVRQSRIRDSIGRYVNPGDKAVLNHEDATAYNESGHLKVQVHVTKEDDKNADTGGEVAATSGGDTEKAESETASNAGGKQSSTRRQRAASE